MLLEPVTLQVLCPMIGSFKHKGLKRLFEHDDRSKLSADMVEKLRLILSALEQARTIDDLDQPSFRLHQLKATSRASGP